MPDMEKVIKGLECIIWEVDHNSMWLPGDDDIRDAISLLKEQEAVEPDTDSEGTCTCGNCGETVGYYPVGCKIPQRLCKFCPECGQAVKWNE